MMVNRFFSGQTQQVSDRCYGGFSAILILLVTAAVYMNSLPNEFTNWDDGSLIVNNRSIRSLELDNLKKIFGNSKVKIWSD